MYTQSPVSSDGVSTRKHRKVQDSTLSHRVHTIQLMGIPSQCCNSPVMRTVLACHRPFQTGLCLTMGTVQVMSQVVGRACCRATFTAALPQSHPHMGVSEWPASTWPTLWVRFKCFLKFDCSIKFQLTNPVLYTMCGRTTPATGTWTGHQETSC